MARRRLPRLGCVALAGWMAYSSWHASLGTFAFDEALERVGRDPMLCKPRVRLRDQVRLALREADGEEAGAHRGGRPAAAGAVTARFHTQ